MAELACGCWLRVSAEMVDYEELGIEPGFGLGPPVEQSCPKHGTQRVVSRTHWEWHVFCQTCGFGSWHGVDAEAAAVSTSRHRNRNPDHDLRAGWDGFTGSVDDENSQGVLFVPFEEQVRQNAGEAARRAAVKRRRRPVVARAPSPTDRLAGWSPPR